MSTINASSNKVTLVNGTFIQVPKQAHWNFSLLDNLIPTPIPPITITTRVIQAIVDSKNPPEK